MATANPPAANQTPRGRAQDRREVAGGQKYEVEYEAQKMGIEPGVVRTTIKAAGNSRTKVEQEIKWTKGK